MSKIVEKDTSLVVSSASANAKQRKSFYAQEEEIEIKPSTELIPDEYEHDANNKILLHIFRASLDHEIAADLSETLQKIDYNINDENHLHDLNSKKDFFQDLEKIKKETKGKTALVLVFIGFFDVNSESGTLLMMEERESVSIRSIWNMFSSNNCPELKDKPKIFVFCTSPEPPRGIQTDSLRHIKMDISQVYDFPAEADILIVYNQISDETMTGHKENFFTHWCENIATYSKKHDIIDLVSYGHDTTKFSPLVVSTLTRKFYLTSSAEREHYLTLNENNDNMEEILKKLQQDLDTLTAPKKKKDKLFSFRSFRTKAADKPKVVNEQRKMSKDVKKSVVPREKQPQSSKLVNDPLNARYKRSNSSSIGTRSRNMSETDSGIVNKKPMWKF